MVAAKTMHPAAMPRRSDAAVPAMAASMPRRDARQPVEPAAIPVRDGRRHAEPAAIPVRDPRQPEESAALPSLDAASDERTLEWLFRVAVSMCFIGHGAFGLIGKVAWLPYFGVAGIGEDAAWLLMPMIGAVDVAAGIIGLVSPRRAVLAYMAVWAVWTAVLRPLAGEGAWETLERAGNYGVPIAFLIACGAWRGRSWRQWLAPVRVVGVNGGRRSALVVVLTCTTAALLIGHGALGAVQGKAVLAAHLAAVGLPGAALPVVGWFEIALGVAIALRPTRPLPALLVLAAAWKIATELLYPMTGAPVWEFVERGGSYFAPLALLVLTRPGSLLPRSPRWARAAAEVRAGGVAGRVHARRNTAPRTAPLVRSMVVPVFAASAALLACAGRPAVAQDVVRTAGPVPADTSLADRLRAGGYVLVCRHAITGPDPGYDGPVSFTDRSTQRLLSAAGEAQARRIGEALRRLRIPFGEVYASPYFRTFDSATLTFGRAEADRALIYSEEESDRRALRALLSTPPAVGTNRALMTHQGVLYSTLPGFERGDIDEGDCIVVKPLGDAGFEVVRQVRAADWARMR